MLKSGQTHRQGKLKLIYDTIQMMVSEGVDKDLLQRSSTVLLVHCLGATFPVCMPTSNAMRFVKEQ